MKRNDSKSALRVRFRAYRWALCESEYRARGQTICNRLVGLPAIEEARSILLYWPRIRSREIDIRPLFAAMRAKHILLPVVEGSTMFATPFVSEQDLMPNQFGILEPVIKKRVAGETIDVIVVPALGADRRGFRIGYGGGYYDRYLADRSGTFVCPVFDACVLQAVPIAPHDIAVHSLVTETTAYSSTALPAG